MELEKSKLLTADRVSLEALLTGGEQLIVQSVAELFEGLRLSVETVPVMLIGLDEHGGPAKEEFETCHLSAIQTSRGGSDAVKGECQGNQCANLKLLDLLKKVTSDSTRHRDHIRKVDINLFQTNQSKEPNTSLRYRDLSNS